MPAQDWEQQLRAEGFKRVYTWEDGPMVHYPDHTHEAVSAHIILDGEMTVTVMGETRTYKVGDRFDVDPNTVHSARMGPKGCRYLIGEK
ncbi:MAG: cupin domain-containing protein [Acidobacteria bacterium]|nr:cupin domain-containing protein [Acidobacteriota bacterium]